MDVTFFLAEGEIEGLRALDPNRDWRELQRGERAWVLQTYLRLARAGHPVRLANQLPSPLDYLDVARPEAAKRAVGRLLDDPELYRRMVAHGRRRADEYTTAAIVERWRELFDELLPRALAAGNGRARPGVSLQLRRWVHRAASVFM